MECDIDIKNYYKINEFIYVWRQKYGKVIKKRYDAY